MLTLTFSDEIGAKLAAGIKAAADFTPAMRQIANTMRTDVVFRFENEQGPDGRRWPISQRAAEDGGLTLTDTGHLLNSIVASHDERSAIAGTNLIYAAIHQFGGRIAAKGIAGGGKKALKTPFGPRGAVTMPARPFLGFGPGDAERFGDILVEHLDKAMRA